MNKKNVLLLFTIVSMIIFSFSFAYAVETVTLDWGELTVSYDGQPHVLNPVCPIEITDGTQLYVVKTASSSEDNIAAGIYKYQAFIGKNFDGQSYTPSANYTISNPTATLTIEQRPISVTWSNLEVPYDGGSKVPSAEIDFETGEVFTYIVGIKTDNSFRFGVSDPGTYTAKVYFTREVDGQTKYYELPSTNYTITNNETTFTILEKPTLTINWGEQTSFIYDGQVHYPTATANLEDGEYLYVDGKQIVPGTYQARAIVCSSITDTGYTPLNKYNVVNDTINYTIRKINLDDLSITLYSDGKEFDNQVAGPIKIKKATEISTGEEVLLLKDYVVNDGASVKKVGAYQFKITATNNESVIEGNDLIITYTITPKPITATWTNTSFEYDGEVHIPTATLNSGFEGYELNFDTVVEVSGEYCNGEYEPGTYTAKIINLGSNEIGAGYVDPNFQITNPTCEFTIVGTGTLMKGDLDNDKLITIVDVRLLLQEFIDSAGSTDWSEDDLKVMDMDDDKKIDIIDVRLLLQLFIDNS